MTLSRISSRTLAPEGTVNVRMRNKHNVERGYVMRMKEGDGGDDSHKTKTRGSFGTYKL